MAGPGYIRPQSTQDRQLDLFETHPPEADPGPVLVAFDLETTGLWPSRADIIEVAGVKFTLDGAEFGTFQQFADPGYDVPPIITDKTGISTEMLTGAPAPLDVVRSFMEWVGDEPILVAHNAPFDAEFVAVCLKKGRVAWPECKVIDTLMWARAKCPGLPNHKLGTLLKHIGANTEGLHRGLVDAEGVKALTLYLARLTKKAKEAVQRRAKPLQMMADARNQQRRKQ